MSNHSMKIAIAMLISGCAMWSARAHWRILTVHGASLPRVVLHAESTAPKAIEQHTGETVTHDYARAWQDFADCLDANQTDLLNDYFTGPAKARLAHRIADQRKAGIRTHYVDHGHEVTAVFYSPDGGEMQLEDRAQLEIQVFDGQRMIDSSNTVHKYLVLMTPGADRWFVRSLESVPDDLF
jgi:hypothetical protein